MSRFLGADVEYVCLAPKEKIEDQINLYKRQLTTVRICPKEIEKGELFL